MAFKRDACKNHPERAAIGICVITRVPICPECSTQYEGVNYSKEGLAILRGQRTQAKSKGRATSFLIQGVAIIAIPLALLAFSSFCYFTLWAVIEVQKNLATMNSNE